MIQKSRQFTSTSFGSSKTCHSSSCEALLLFPSTARVERGPQLETTISLLMDRHLIEINCILYLERWSAQFEYIRGVASTMHSASPYSIYFQQRAWAKREPYTIRDHDRAKTLFVFGTENLRHLNWEKITRNIDNLEHTKKTFHYWSPGSPSCTVLKIEECQIGKRKATWALLRHPDFRIPRLPSDRNEYRVTSSKFRSVSEIHVLGSRLLSFRSLDFRLS